QAFQVDVGVPPGADRAGIEAEFHREHERLYGHADPASAVELVELRVRIHGRLPTQVPTGADWATVAPIKDRTRRVRFAGAWHETPIVSRHGLKPGSSVAGPAIIEQPDAAVLVPPGFAATTGAFGELLLQRGR